MEIWLRFGFRISFIIKVIFRIVGSIVFNWRKSITNGKFNISLIPEEKIIVQSKIGRKFDFFYFDDKLAGVKLIYIFAGK